MMVVVIAMMVVVIVALIMIMAMVVVIMIMIMMMVTVIVRIVGRLVGHRMLRLQHSPPRHTAGQSSPALVALHRVHANRLGAYENERAGQRLKRPALQSVDAVGAD